MTALSVGAFIDMLPPLRVRTYSISSSPYWKPSHASLSLSVVVEPAKSGQGSHLGVASNFLSDLVPGDAVHITIRPSKKQFHPPQVASAYPIIMIAAGSGIAPFRGFIQDRAIQKRNGVQLQPAILFFGCHGAQDDLYRDELDKFEAEGIVNVRRAFSTDKSASPTKPKAYIQDRLLADKTDVIELWRKGAKVFVCGGISMADGVKQAFTSIIYLAAEADGNINGRSQDELFEEAFDQRYVTEIFSQT